MIGRVAVRAARQVTAFAVVRSMRSSAMVGALGDEEIKWKSSDEEIEQRRMRPTGHELLSGYTFDDVALVPKYNNIQSRLEPKLETWLTRKTKIGMPLMPANMDTVMGERLARVIVANGGMPIFHRFASQEKQLEWVKEFSGKCYISAGLQEFAKLGPLLAAGARGVCIDIAHGHSNVMIDFIKAIRKDYPTTEIIAGNVCSVVGYEDLVAAGADCVKVGVGPGSACTTRIVTGFGVPQFTAIYQIAQTAKRTGVPIIADGGIRNSRDVVLALAAGATSVMIGNAFAKTFESEAPKRLVRYNESGTETTHSFDLRASGATAIPGLGGFELGISEVPKGYQVYAGFRGQASADFQQDYYGGVKKGTVAEGISFQTKVTGPAQGLIDNLLGGLRSGLTYGGGRTIAELQRKAEFIKVTSTYARESFPRPDQ
eukprot:c46318_g1_i1.p2 GENE.c46318_g1_i1~~c46318_g1_i1.p2  ORF type:complete len:436 (+),score=88.32 c46318_g1_i1:24-1310(+)